MFPGAGRNPQGNGRAAAVGHGCGTAAEAMPSSCLLSRHFHHQAGRGPHIRAEPAILNVLHGSFRLIPASKISSFSCYS